MKAERVVLRGWGRQFVHGTITVTDFHFFNLLIPAF